MDKKSHYLTQQYQNQHYLTQPAPISATHCTLGEADDRAHRKEPRNLGSMTLEELGREGLGVHVEIRGDTKTACFLTRRSTIHSQTAVFLVFFPRVGFAARDAPRAEEETSALVL